MPPGGVRGGGIVGANLIAGEVSGRAGRANTLEWNAGDYRLRRAGFETREPQRLAGFDSLAFRWRDGAGQGYFIWYENDPWSMISPVSFSRNQAGRCRQRLLPSEDEVARFDSSPAASFRRAAVAQW